MECHDDCRKAISLLKSLINDRELDQKIPEEIEADAEFSELYASIRELRQAFFAMGSGNLEHDISGKGYLLGALKGFQASLRHLTWQTQAIASGDFTQRVDFMGAFSESFNQMTEELDSTIDALRKSEEKYRLLTEFASDVIWVLNLKHERFTFISPSVYHLRGITVEEAMKETLDESMTEESKIIVKQAITRNLEQFTNNPQTHNHYINEIQQPCKDGELIWVEVSTQFRYNQAKEIEIVGVSRNIEARKNAEAKITNLSYHDQLTGLYNRRFYEEQLIKIDIEANLPVALIMADVNGLKLTNDVFGHLAGDSLLKAISDIMRQHCRDQDILARIGGDEFVIIMPRTEIWEAKSKVKGIRESLNHQSTQTRVLSVSFGWATKNEREENLNNIYTAAEDQMYHHKLTDSSTMKSKTIKMITDSLFEKDASEKKHCERVSCYCKRMAGALELDLEATGVLELAGMLHDIGKIGIDEEILKKHGELDTSDWNEIRRHPEIGYQILRSSHEFAHVAEFVLSHHERPDGKGYPRGISGEQIPMEAKVLAVVEAYDTMINKQASKEALSEDEAIRILIDSAGTKFDYEITRVFVGKVLRKTWKEE